MYEILEKEKLAESTFLMKISAPEVARKARPGQFIILRIDEKGERIPLTIADYDENTITIVFLVVGYTTDRLSKLNERESLLDFLGPLGCESHIEKYGTACLIGGGLGIAPIYPIAKALKLEKQNEVITIIGARNKDVLFWQDRFESISDQYIICTDDGSFGKKGFVTAALSELMESKQIDRVIAIGPPIMMQNVCKLTDGKIETLVSLNPIMIDGMGMCGGCRVVVDEEVKFACVDGPEFDGQKVDWSELINRNKAYLCEEESCKVQR